MRQVRFSDGCGVLAHEGFTHDKTSVGKRSRVPPPARSSARDTQGLCLCLRQPWVGGDALLLPVVFSHLGMCPSFSSASLLHMLLCSLCCIPRDLLMSDLHPALEEKLQRWRSAEQPCDRPLHGEHRAVGLLFVCLLLEGSEDQCRLWSWKEKEEHSH